MGGDRVTCTCDDVPSGVIEATFRQEVGWIVG